jgi:hypothetical protein
VKTSVAVLDRLRNAKLLGELVEARLRGDVGGREVVCVLEPGIGPVRE